MALTQADIDALEKAIVSGVKKVKFSDRETEFRDLDEMERILNRAKGTVGGKSRAAYRFTSYGRGYK
jgi:hypothetical protein